MQGLPIHIRLILRNFHHRLWYKSTTLCAAHFNSSTSSSTAISTALSTTKRHQPKRQGSENSFLEDLAPRQSSGRSGVWAVSFGFAILVNEDTSENYEDEDYDRSDDSAADGATR